MAYTEAAYEGCAWPVTQQGGRLLSVAGNAGLARFTSSAAETIDALHLPLTQVVAGQTLRCEVREWASIPPTVSTDTFAPNEDVNQNGWTSDDGTTPVYEHIDEASLDTSDYIDAEVGSAYLFQVASSGGVSSDRVTVLRIVVVCECQTRGGSTHVDVAVRLDDDGDGVADSDYDSDNHPDGVDVDDSDGQVTLLFEWARYPLTGARWTDAQVQLFDTGEAGASINAPSGHDALRVFQMFMEVESYPSPAAEGAVSPSSGGWKRVPLDSSWSKADSTEYGVLVLSRSSDGQVVWPSLDSGEACPHAGWSSYVPSVDGGVIDAVGEESTAVRPLILETSGGSASVDSQPYAQLVRESVHSGRTVEQEVTPGSSLTAGWVRLVAACHPDTEDDLEVEVRKRSDDSVVGAIAVSPGDLPDPDSPRKLQQVDGPLDSTGTVSGQHYVHLSSTEPEATGWEVAVLDADSPPVSAESAGFGGDTDQATVDGSEDDDLDVPAIIAERPSAPTGFTATAGTAEVSLSWDATSLGSSFDRYLVWRNGYVIAEVTDESITALTDTGALMGVEETWAIQVRDTDGVVSAKATDTATAEVLASGSGSHRVTSLHDPTVNVGLRASADQMTWRFPNRVSQQRQMGRDGHRVLRAKRGKAEVLEITANLGVGKPEQDRALFDDLLALRDADVPHLTLTTIWGHRMLCAVRVDEGSERQIADWGQATVRLVSVGERPTPVVIDAA